MNPSKTLVVALGNPLVGPDGFGGAVLARLCATGRVGGAVHTLDAHTDLLGRLDQLAQYQRVILIDAVVAERGAGGVTTYEEKDLADWPDHSPSCHEISPMLAVRLFRCLHPQAATRVVLVGLAVSEVSRSLGVPDAAVEAGAALVADLLSGFPPITPA